MFPHKEHLDLTLVSLLASSPLLFLHQLERDPSVQGALPQPREAERPFPGTKRHSQLQQ